MGHDLKFESPGGNDAGSSFSASRLDATRRMSATELVCAAPSQQRLRRCCDGAARPARLGVGDSVVGAQILYKLAWPRTEKKASIFHAITDPPVTKIRLWASFGVQITTNRWWAREKKLFLMLFLLKKTVKSTPDGRAHHRNRLGVVELVGSEPWIIARVENGVTKVSPKRQKTPKIF